MATIDTRTPRLNLPVPVVTNALKDDCPRLVEAFTTLDGAVAGNIDNLREQWRRQLAEVGLTLVSGSFEEGATVTKATDAVWHIAGGQCYTWGGEFPKTVAAGSTPETSGGIGLGAWLSVGDATLRGEITIGTGFSVIGRINSFGELRSTAPEADGVRVLLKSYYADGISGGGEFVSRSSIGLTTPPTDDGGIIAVVSSMWYWERVNKENVTVDDFGAVSFEVQDDGSLPSGTTSSSAAFQNMFDSLGKIKTPDEKGRGYLIDQPVLLQDTDYWAVNLGESTIIKTSTTTTGLDAYIPIQGAYVEGDVNCVFFIGGSDSCRYWTFSGGYIDCHLAPSNNRPVGIYMPQVVGYSIEKVRTRGCKHGLWVKSGWLGGLTLCRFNDSTSHGVFYDSSRFTSTGNVAQINQSATSLHVSSCYSSNAELDGWHMEKCQYINFQSTACDNAGSVSGGSSYYFSECDVAGDIGAEIPSSSADAYITMVGGTATLTFNCYDEIDTINPVILASGGASAVLNLSLRTQRQRLFTITGKDTHITVPRITFWNGKTWNLPASSVDKGSTLEIDTGRVGRGVVNYADGVQAFHKEYAYRGQLLSDGDFENFRISQHKKGFSGPEKTFKIPLTEINNAFPCFFGAASVYREIFKIRVNNYYYYADGVTFSYDGTTLSVNTDNQVVYGGEGIAISSLSISEGNLEITLNASQTNVTFTITPL